jgi:hypothetical protein
VAIHRRVAMAAALAVIAIPIFAATVAAHEHRHVGGYDVVVGFIGEPVFTGQKSGLELQVTRDEQPVTGLEATLQAEAIYQGQTRALPLSPRFGQEGWYQSVFFPTAAGPYTFHIFGTIEGVPVDESFTSSEEGFDEVQEAQTGQFPTVLPPAAEVAADADRGAAAADQAPLMLGLGIAGVVLGLVAIGLALALWRRPRTS